MARGDLGEFFVGISDKLQQRNIAAQNQSLMQERANLYRAQASNQLLKLEDDRQESEILKGVYQKQTPDMLPHEKAELVANEAMKLGNPRLAEKWTATRDTESRNMLKDFTDRIYKVAEADENFATQMVNADTPEARYFRQKSGMVDGSIPNFKKGNFKVGNFKSKVPITWEGGVIPADEPVDLEVKPGFNLGNGMFDGRKVIAAHPTKPHTEKTRRDYIDRNGNVVLVDPNDPNAQKIIDEKGLKPVIVTAGVPVPTPTGPAWGYPRQPGKPLTPMTSPGGQPMKAPPQNHL